MTTGGGSLEGAPPHIMVGRGNPETLKYGRLWTYPEYRTVAPGEQFVQAFLAQARPRRGASLIDFGCGTGRAAVALAIISGLNVTMIDFVNNCLDADIRSMLATHAHTLRFIKADLECGPLPVAAYGYCTDVMEHIPPDKVNAVLNNILLAAQHVFFSIATVPDVWGKLIGESLHLTVQSYAWWLERFRERNCVVHWSQEIPDACLFYVSAWQRGEDLVKAGILNAEDNQIRANVRRNCADGWQQVSPHETNDFEVLILGGGPSLTTYESEIRSHRETGAKLITLNGAYNWALEHGLQPSAQIVVDARAFNARFTSPVTDTCIYLIASQCDPGVLQRLPRERTYLWHTAPDSIGDILKEYYEIFWPIPGGSTVLLRAIPLMRMLGYRRFHLFGCDSCLSTPSPDMRMQMDHHAYTQPENDGNAAIPVTVNGGSGEERVFWCHPWMVAQAQEFMDLIKFLGDEIELKIYGDGLLAYILKVGASLETWQETK